MYDPALPAKVQNARSLSFTVQVHPTREADLKPHPDSLDFTLEHVPPSFIGIGIAAAWRHAAALLPAI